MGSARWRRIVSCVLFAVLLFLSLAKCADILEYKEARKKYTPFYESETNFDVIFLGTSHVWNHVLPMEMWKDYGIASYNWGFSNCTPAENYYIIKHVLKYTTPRVVVLDTYGLVEYDGFNNGKYRSDRIEQQHVQFDSMPFWSKDKYEASQDVFDDYANNKDFIWNFMMYHNRWSELQMSDFSDDLSTEKGASFLTGLGKASFTLLSSDEKTEINSVCYPYFLDIIQYCQERGIQVLCTFLPCVPSEIGQRVANTIGDIVEQYPNCSYVNMVTKDIVNPDIDFCPDNEHLNYSGARKTTAWLGQYLSEHYNLDNYKDNVSWISDYQEYYNYKESVINTQNTLPEYLVLLSDPDYQAELEVYDQDLMNSEVLCALYENAGVKLVYTAKDTEQCAHLRIYSNFTSQIISEVDFTWDGLKSFDINRAVKVIENDSPEP